MRRYFEKKNRRHCLENNNGLPFPSLARGGWFYKHSGSDCRQLCLAMYNWYFLCRPFYRATITTCNALQLKETFSVAPPCGFDTRRNPHPSFISDHPLLLSSYKRTLGPSFPGGFQREVQVRNSATNK